MVGIVQVGRWMEYKGIGERWEGVLLNTYETLHMYPKSDW